jgi:hypothetical protein
MSLFLFSFAKGGRTHNQSATKWLWLEQNLQENTIIENFISIKLQQMDGLSSDKSILLKYFVPIKSTICGWSTGFLISLRLIHDKLTTKNRSQCSFNFVQDSFTTDFYLRFVRDRFMTRSNMFVANESWSRLCCGQFGQSTSRMPSCDFYAIRRHHMILQQAKTFSWRRNKADSVGDVFFRWIIFNVTSLPHDSFATHSWQL